MEIRNFITFKEIVDTGSFTAAAKKLHYAQSTVTSHIQAIEESMGILLFDRIGKKIILTDKGKKLYDKVLELLETYEEIKLIPDDEEELSGEIQIRIPDSLMLYKLSSVFKEYQEKYPKIKITHYDDCLDIVGNVAKGEIDIGFNIGIFPEHPGLVCKNFGEVEFCLVYPPSFDKFDKDANQTFLYTEEECCFRVAFNEFVSKNDIKSTNQIVTRNVEIIKEYVQQGLGISVMPKYIVEKEVECGKIKSIPIETDETYTIHMVYNKSKTISPAILKFIDLVNERLK